jgi:hypothetical protein
MRARLTVLALLLLLVAAPLAAQTTTAKLVWDMANTVADANTFTYSLKDGSAAAVTLTASCSTVATMTECQAPIAPPAAGPHSYVLTASSPLGSAASAALVGSTPGAPLTLRITITISVP